MILTILITIYILSFLRMYFWFKTAHSKDGTWRYIKPDISSLFITVLPFLNTLASIMFTAVSITGKEHNSNFSKFFNVKK